MYLLYLLNIREGDGLQEELITTKELCEWLKISKATASNWRKQGMPYYGKDRSLRYRKTEIERWMRQQDTKSK